MNIKVATFKVSENQVIILCAPVCVEKHDKWFSTAYSYLDFISISKNVHSDFLIVRKRAKIRNQYNQASINQGLLTGCMGNTRTESRPRMAPERSDRFQYV